MMHTRIKNGDWIVICDGRKALLFENAGDEEFPNFKTREVLEHKSEANRDIDADKPGRVHESATAGRSAIEQVDHHDLEETAFLAQVSKRLDELVAGGEVRHLVVVAPPRALGAIRKTYSAGLRAAIRTEIDQDLVKMPIDEIETKFALRNNV
ncbi:host attachment protein [Methylovirgula sp. HY1]|uniref:baeRF12 domain-containing protein n=1 Tax=Methylovirgula sp. HY1 TaxID=2822761 RepID=UPI001C5AC580|nr:host attachment family protein [Methylovirgula sp. HY1]